MAIKLWPENGHPYNQMAVLSTYSQDDFQTLYYYCCSLSVAMPFRTSTNNLKVLFEKNRKTSSPSKTISSQGRNRTTNCSAPHGQDWDDSSILLGLSDNELDSQEGMYSHYFMRLLMRVLMMVLRVLMMALRV